MSILDRDRLPNAKVCSNIDDYFTENKQVEQLIYKNVLETRITRLLFFFIYMMKLSGKLEFCVQNN